MHFCSVLYSYNVCHHFVLHFELPMRMNYINKLALPALLKYMNVTSAAAFQRNLDGKIVKYIYQWTIAGFNWVDESAPTTLLLAPQTHRKSIKGFICSVVSITLSNPFTVLLTFSVSLCRLSIYRKAKLCQGVGNKNICLLLSTLITSSTAAPSTSALVLGHCPLWLHWSPPLNCKLPLLCSGKYDCTTDCNVVGYSLDWLWVHFHYGVKPWSGEKSLTLFVSISDAGLGPNSLSSVLEWSRDQSGLN